VLFNQNIPNLKIFLGLALELKFFKARFFLLAGETIMLVENILFTTTGYDLTVKNGSNS